MLGLEIDRMSRTIDSPLTPTIGQYAYELGVVGVLMEPVKCLIRDMLETVKTIDRLRTEVDQYVPHPDFLQHMGCEIGVELSYHTHRCRMRWLAQSTPSLSRNCLAEEVIGVVKPLLLDEGSVFENDAKPIGGTRIHEPRDIVSGSRVLAGPTSLGRQFLPLARHIDLEVTRLWYQSGHL